MTTKRRFDLKPAGRVAGSALLFLVIPVVFFVAVAQLTRAKGPQWLAFSFENPYNYLMNSLLLVNGRAPSSIEHPGTTTQVFGATVLRLSSTKSADDLVASVLQHPEKHILEYDLDDRIHIRTCIGGKGMTASAGYAKDSIKQIFDI